MKKRATIFGIGRMGLAICQAMHKLGYRLDCIDVSKSQLGKLRHFLPYLDYDAFMTSSNSFKDDALRAIKKKPDVVISSLPYHQTEIVGLGCIDNGVRYCDLGGRVDVSERINTEAVAKNSLVATDLGLAPGWVNIMAEFACEELKGCSIKDVTMMVGGLPKNPELRNPFKYNVTWSVDGLINEYRDDCIILMDGRIKVVEGMEGLETVETKIGPLECFYTSGGASHSIDSMTARGVQNCSYKTLRYKGHCHLVKFLIRDCYLPDSCLKQLFHVGCSGSEKDLVIIKVSIAFVRGTGGGEETYLNKEIVVDSDDNLSAMQKATAFPISAVASIMADGKLDGLSSVSYGDIPQEEFAQKLSSLGITHSL